MAAFVYLSGWTVSACGRYRREGRRSRTARLFEYPGTGWVKYLCHGLGDWRFPVTREDTRENQFKLMVTMLIKPVYSNYFMVSKSLIVKGINKHIINK